MSDLNLKGIVITLAITIAVFIGAWFLYSSPTLQERGQEDSALVSNETAATVNGESIYSADVEALKTQIAAQQGVDVASLDTQTQEALTMQSLQTLIAQALLTQAVANAGIEVSATDVEAQLTQIASTFEDEAAMEAALTAEGLTKETLQAQIESDLATQMYLSQTLDLQSITATEEDIAQTYDQVAAQGDVPPLEEVRAQVETLVIQQKQQDLIGVHINSLREEATIEIL